MDMDLSDIVYYWFYMLQDTTLALHAFAKYAKATNHKKGNSTVIIEDDSGFHREVHVDKQNSLLVQTVDLPKVPGTYTASIKGDGYIYAQVSRMLLFPSALSYLSNISKVCT